MKSGSPDAPGVTFAGLDPGGDASEPGSESLGGMTPADSDRDIGMVSRWRNVFTAHDGQPHWSRQYSEMSSADCIQNEQLKISEKCD
jgi:hypothetical protein